jgi:hypothetical protein
MSIKFCQSTASIVILEEVCTTAAKGSTTKATIVAPIRVIEVVASRSRSNATKTIFAVLAINSVPKIKSFINMDITPKYCN